jgi:pilus assembly protein CpaE
MNRLLIIDDEPIYQKMVMRAVVPLDLDVYTANDGVEGLRTAQEKLPDLIVCDVLMPRLTGYEVTRLLRRDPRFAHTPILILTAQAELSEKLEAFEAGADDHMTKPFEPAELVARLSVLLRRGDSMRALESGPVAQAIQPTVIAIHSLRGGIGCSSMAVNMAIGLKKLWGSSVIVLDLVLTAGQVALMLNATLKRTWSDLAKIKPDEMDWDALKSIIGEHESGVHYIAAPTFPSEAELFTPEIFEKAFDLLKEHFEYIVVDLPHDFGGMPLQVLDAADTIVLMVAPELAATRAAFAALDTYKKLGYPSDKIVPVLNYTYEGKWLSRKKIETALKHSVNLEIPYTPDLLIEAINLGRPVTLGQPQEEISETLQYIASQISKPEHRDAAAKTLVSRWQMIGKKLLGG